MPSPKPTILIIHGAWHTPLHFSPLITLLTAQSYPVSCPLLPTCNDASPPNNSLHDDVALIRSTTLTLVADGKEVIALLHSYGGVVGTDALAGLGVETRSKKGEKGGVKRLVYMCAFIPFMGQSLADIFGGRLPPWILDEPPYLTPTSPTKMFYNDILAPGDDYWAAQLVKHPRQAQYDDKVSHEAWREMAVTYLFCEVDQALPVEVQQMMVGRVEEAGVEVKAESCGAGHSPFLSLPEEVVGVLGRAAEEE